MSATRKRPKPIRLTEQRALALAEAAERGLAEWSRAVRDTVQDPLSSLEEMRQAQELDEQGVLALDAIELIRTRYLPPEPETKTLF